MVDTSKYWISVYFFRFGSRMPSAEYLLSACLVGSANDLNNNMGRKFQIKIS